MCSQLEKKKQKKPLLQLALANEMSGDVATPVPA
jgi:hypothetical protein